MQKIIFACVHNAGRSQMVAAFFNRLADHSKAEAVSAGTEPGVRVHPEVLSAMQELGADLSGAKPQKLTQELAEGASLLITMGCGAGTNARMFRVCGGTTGPSVMQRAFRKLKSGRFVTRSRTGCKAW